MEDIWVTATDMKHKHKLEPDKYYYLIPEDSQFTKLLKNLYELLQLHVLDTWCT